LQGGSENGSGKGGKSAFPLGRAFKDEFDPRLSHSGRGVLSMANSGPDNNKSQFFITLCDCRYLDNKHTVFGRLVGGTACLDRIEAVGTSDSEVPLEDVLLIRTEVFSSPVEAADSLIVKDIEARRAASSTSSSSSSSSSKAAVPSVAAATITGAGAGAGVGKYVLALNSASHLSSSSSSSSGAGQAGAGAGAAVAAAGAEEEGPAVKKVKSAGFGSFSSW
jgi:peptidyl-prolyl cis-trans isomerase-like protein 2